MNKNTFIILLTFFVFSIKTSAQELQSIVSDTSNRIFSSFSFGYFELNNKNYFFSRSVNEEYSLQNKFYGLWKADSALNDASLISVIPELSKKSFKFKGNQMFFCLEKDGAFGKINTLWSTDGTSSGTNKILSFKGGQIGEIAVTSNFIYFVVENYVNINNQYVGTSSLFKTDCISGELELIKIFNKQPAFLFAYNEKILFAADDEVNGYELWISDGSNFGTNLVKDIKLGNGGSFDVSNGKNTFTQMNGIIYFMALNGINCELWRTDGTEAGTFNIQLPGLYNYGLLHNMGKFTVMDNHIYFARRSSMLGIELWKSNGTSAGTTMVKDIEPGANSSLPSEIIARGNLIYFFTHWYDKLWISDGTEANTRLIKEFNFPSYDFNPSPFFNNNSFYFLHFLENGKLGIWKTDSNSENTLYIEGTDFENTNSFYNNLFYIVGDKLFVPKFDPEKGYEPFAFHGDSLRLIKDLIKPSVNFFEFYNFNNHIYFQTNRDSIKLWRTNGNANNANLIHSFYGTSVINYLGTLNSNLYYFLETNDDQNGLWQINDVSQEKTLIKNINLYKVNKTYGKVKNHLIFNGITDSGVETFKSDGTEIGTIPIINKITTFVEVNNNIYFLTDSSLIVSEDLINFTTLENNFVADLLYSVNGTLYYIKDKNELWTYQNGVKILLKIFDPNSIISSITSFKNKLFFTASLSGVGTSIFMNYELWCSDGTQDGTRIFKEINPSVQTGSIPTNIQEINNKLYFVANDGINGNEIWISNGTEAETKILKDINLGINNSINYFDPNFTIFEGEVFFIAQTEANGIELWKTDGSSEGTKMVIDLDSGKNSSFPRNLIVANNKLFFVASDGNSSNNLWVYNPNCKQLNNLESPTNDLKNVNVVIKSKSNIGQINATIGIINNSKVDFIAPSIQLNPGFFVEQGTVFKAIPGGCN